MWNTLFTQSVRIKLLLWNYCNYYTYKNVWAWISVLKQSAGFNWVYSFYFVCFIIIVITCVMLIYCVFVFVLIWRNSLWKLHWRIRTVANYYFHHPLICQLFSQLICFAYEMSENIEKCFCFKHFLQPKVTSSDNMCGQQPIIYKHMTN